jgi:hypothetical protein
MLPKTDATRASDAYVRSPTPNEEPPRRRGHVAQVIEDARARAISQRNAEALLRELRQTRARVGENQILGGSDFIWFTSSAQGRLFRKSIVLRRQSRSTSRAT